MHIKTHASEFSLLSILFVPKITVKTTIKSLGWLNICQLTEFDTASLMFKILKEKMPRHKSYLLNAKPCINITQDQLTLAI